MLKMSQHCYTQSTVDITSSANKQNLIFMPSQSSAKYHVGEAITITQNKSPQKATFKFVVLDGPTIIDPEAKRLIKKHVMADIGRSRRKRTKWSDEKLGMVKGSPNTFDIFVPPIPRYVPPKVAQAKHWLTPYPKFRCGKRPVRQISHWDVIPFTKASWS